MRHFPPALAAAFLLIGTDLADAATRPGYQPLRHWVSHLSLGDRGWLGTTKLVTCGLLLLVAAVGARRHTAPAAAGHPTPGGLGRGTRRWIAATGAGLLLAAAAPIDPGLGYPPGVTATQTWVGGVHDLAGLLTFTCLAVAGWWLGTDVAAATAWHRWRPLGRVIALAVVAAFVTCSALITLDYAGAAPGAPSGLFERIALYLGVAWLGTATCLIGRHRIPRAARPAPAASTSGR